MGNKLTNTYYQCRAGRDATFKDRSIETATGATLGCVVGGESARVGEFSSDSGLESMCFIGSRVLKGNTVANQNLCMTFDPAIMSCLTCRIEHNFLMGSKPVCVCVSDQNFVPNLSGGNNCISIVRLESASLSELTEICLEIFERSTFPPGSVICLRSASHLHRSGLTLYAQDWNRCTDTLSKRIAGIQICPLIPVIRADIPGSLASDLVELASWYTEQYEGSTLGLLATWSALASALTVMTCEDLQSPVFRTVALPVNLSPGAPLAPHRFRNTSSRRVTSPGCCAKTTNELLTVLIKALSSDLGIQCHPEDSLVRDPILHQDRKDKIESLILVGASHMRRTATVLQEAGYSVKLVAIPGNIMSDSAIKATKKELAGLSVDPCTAIVYDLFGKFTYRYVQEDGGLVLPVPIMGSHHLLGDITVCSDNSFKSLVSKIVSLITVNIVPSVVLPPIPRYIAGGCCTEDGHSTNVGKVGFPEEMVSKIANLRKVLKGELTGSTLGGFWVTDVIGCLDSAGVGNINTPPTADSLKELFTPDNVHLTSLGYSKLAKGILESVDLALKKQSTSDCVVSGGRQTFFWRGFISPHGGTRTVHRASEYKQRGGRVGSSERGRGHLHPYRGGGSRRGRK